MPIAPIPGDSIAAKYAGFEIIDVAYKRVTGTDVPASILLPKGLKAGRTPVTVHWHGGGLVVGQRLFPDWYADWVLDLTLEHNAIAVSPDYRLLPEATGVDILEDAKDLYAWLLKPGNLAQYLPHGVEPDLKHILVTGESAGGWLALQSGFQIPQSVAAVIAHYPMIDMKSAHFTEDYHKELFDPPAPQLDRRLLDDHIRELSGKEVITSRLPPEGVPLLLIAFQSGRFGSMFGQQSELYPLEQLDTVSSFPPLWILHGDKDNVVPVEGTRKFAKAFQSKLPEVPFHLSIGEGGMHGFDNHDASSGLPATLTDWVKPGVELVQRYWPS
ncbi:hypothetical protein AMS68_002234 [Peltaster fructicola]|uniref:Alpha/beta hydrolase fold-3 domain-containing protein n=1 Tax=Peltaster fructicola TaxID=286661 RepID=A0A6H0XPM7_9PEZI|nr:hypothetical protein AMS68_002234 [Peltaster fructicola]